MIGRILEWVQGAHPIFYFLLLMCGARRSVERLGHLGGRQLGRGENPYPAYQYAVALYLGAIGSDMLTFSIGRLTQRLRRPHPKFAIQRPAQD